MNVCSIRAVTLSIFAALGLSTPDASAQTYDQSCVDELPAILDSIDIGNRYIKICENAVPGVEFALRSHFGGVPSLFFHGDMTYLMSLRRDIRPRLPNSGIDIRLVPRTNEIWDVELSYGNNQIEPKRTSKYFIWSQIVVPIAGVRPERLPIDEASTRVFRCATNGGSCITHYSFDFCPNYEHPLIAARDIYSAYVNEFGASLTLAVFASTRLDAENMLDNYAEITRFVRDLLETAQIHLCK